MIDSHTNSSDLICANSAYRSMGGGKIQWIDTAKALGLVLVFWGHLLYNGTLDIVNQAIYSFHMPMYFILSGLVMRKSKLGIQQTVIKRFKRLITPVIIFQLLSLPIFTIQLLKSGDAVSVKHIISEIFYLTGHIAYDDPLWFFICLFQVLVVVDLFNFYNYKTANKFAIMLGAFSLGYILYRLHFVYLGIDKAIWALGFFMVGQTLKGNIDKLMSSKFFILLATIIWLLTGIILNGKFSMYGSYVGNYWYFIPAGISGSIIFFCIAKRFQFCKFINQYAQWTVFIVMSHYFLVSAFNMMAGNIGIKGSFIFDIASLLYVLLALYCYRPICEFVCKKIPILNGN